MVQLALRRQTVTQQHTDRGCRIEDERSAKATGIVELRLTPEESGLIPANAYGANSRSGGWLVARGCHSKELVGKTPGKVLEQCGNPLRVRGLQDQARMMTFLDSQADFGIVVGGSVRIRLPRQRNDHTSVILAHRGKPVASVSAGDFNPCPFAP